MVSFCSIVLGTTPFPLPYTEAESKHIRGGRDDVRLTLLCIKQNLVQPLRNIAMSSKHPLALLLADNDMQIYALGKIEQVFGSFAAMS